MKDLPTSAWITFCPSTPCIARARCFTPGNKKKHPSRSNRLRLTTTNSSGESSAFYFSKLSSTTTFNGQAFNVCHHNSKRCMYVGYLLTAESTARLLHTSADVQLVQLAIGNVWRPRTFNASSSLRVRVFWGFETIGGLWSFEGSLCFEHCGVSRTFRLRGFWGLGNLDASSVMGGF